MTQWNGLRFKSDKWLVLSDLAGKLLKKKLFFLVSISFKTYNLHSFKYVTAITNTMYINVLLLSGKNIYVSLSRLHASFKLYNHTRISKQACTGKKKICKLHCLRHQKQYTNSCTYTGSVHTSLIFFVCTSLLVDYFLSLFQAFWGGSCFS